MALTLARLRKIIRDLYAARARQRGIGGTFMWFMGGVGGWAPARGSGSQEERAGEFADVLAWLATLANVAGIDLDAVVAAKYGAGCPGCGQTPCRCAPAEKP